MKQYEAELVVDSRSVLGEGPVWNAETRCVYWVDITGKRLHTFHVDSGKHEERALPCKISSFAFKESGGAVAAGEGGFYHLDVDGCELQPIADPEKHLPHLFNDGKCDPRGRFYAGTHTQGNGRGGAFYMLDQAGRVTKLFDGVGCSNGIAWSLDFKTMYYIDSPVRTLDAFDYDIESGLVQNRRTLIRYSNDIMPDGMTWDDEGMLWIAEWGGWNVTRWNPHTGERLAVVNVPSQYVTSCIFAGDNLDVLYITTAAQNMSDEQLQNQPHAGGLFRVKTGNSGAPSYLYKG